ncbi:hypothetical protein FB382_001210 [Nocardioides ginsengisegetis]|uniref:SnoaL-like domain-containing protein n=1 Tax=Nocardioides ginsengisegetis TaxID=661491 RepID=A0A7W3P8Z3_9ACTN|nr:hypothetical protein [Nocardioides ginsengisegetis]MBA8802919.1 hypothetical protein [Nocardioides ginsengisegetis]
MILPSLALLTALAPPVAPAPPDPLEVLHAWDAARAAAWAHADVPALRSLYAAGSASGAADVAMLREWRARGVRVEGMSMQVLAARELSATSHRLVLRVTDRLVGAQAVVAGRRVPLPRDEVSRRVLVLVRVAGEWRVEEARDAG